MIKREYHCLVAGLPALFLDATRLAATLVEFKAQLKEELHPSDYNLAASYFLRFDNSNVFNTLTGQRRAFDPLGNFSAESIEEAKLLLRDEEVDINKLDFPPYLSRFIRAFNSGIPLIPDKGWENQLSQLYYEQLAEIDNPFIREWYRYELDLTNMITACNCRRHKVNIAPEMVGDNEITGQLMRSNARDFGISNEFPLIGAILRADDENDFMEREKKYDRVKWEYLDEKVFFHYFTIEFIFTFIVKLGIISRWLRLDKDTGEKLFGELFEKMKSACAFPDEYNL
ncbi:MAG: DUF2764 family protein [Bacteroidales bacterium]|nr:DUF2764 family protein [Bacteroidales bacterium]